MNIRSVFSILLLLCCSPVGSATILSGPGVFEFDSLEAPCSYSLLSNPNGCQHIALQDPATQAHIIQEKQKIILYNKQSYKKKTLLADLFIPAQGISQDGQTVPLMLHVKLSKKGQVWSVKSHSHAPVKGKFHDIKLSNWDIILNTEGGDKIVIDQATAIKVLSDPTLAAKMVNQLVQVKENQLDKQAGISDITVSLGIGGMAKSVMRSRFESVSIKEKQSLAEVLQQGTWSIEMQSLTRMLPVSLIRHELFLYGLDNVPLLHELYQNGMEKGNKLIIGAQAGKGYIRYNGQQIDFPPAAQSAIRYMDISFIGLILGWYQIYG